MADTLQGQISIDTQIPSTQDSTTTTTPTATQTSPQGTTTTTPTPQVDTTRLEVTPQPASMEQEQEQVLTIDTDADTYLVEIDNDNVTFNALTDTLKAEKEGNSHIKVTATAGGKQKAEVEWDMEVTAKGVVPPPVKPIPPLQEPIDLETQEQFINYAYEVVVKENYIGEVRMANGKFEKIWQCKEIDESLDEVTAFYTSKGKSVDKYSDFSDWHYMANDGLLEVDNRSVEVFKNYISILQTAIVDFVDGKDIYIYKNKSMIETLEFNPTDNILTINETIKVALHTETKAKQIMLFLGLDGLY